MSGQILFEGIPIVNQKSIQKLLNRLIAAELEIKGLKQSIEFSNLTVNNNAEQTKTILTKVELIEKCFFSDENYEIINKE